MTKMNANASAEPQDAGEGPRPWRNKAVGAVAAGVVATVGCLWLLRLRELPLGLPAEWSWRQRLHPVAPGPGMLLACAVLVAGACLALDAARRAKVARAQATAGLLLLLIGSYLLPARMVLEGQEVYGRAILSICSDLSMGYLSEATKIHGLRAWLRDTSRRTNLGIVPARVATHPPGPVLFFYAADRLAAHHKGIDRLALVPLRAFQLPATELAATARKVGSGKFTRREMAAASLAMWVLMVASPLTVLGAWLLGLWWLGGRESLAAAALAAGLPALAVFTPGIDATAAALAVWVLALWILALKRGRWFWAAGLVLGLGLQWTYGLAVLVIIMAVLWAVMGRKGGWWAWVWMGGGVVALHLPLIAAGYNPVANFFGSIAAQHHIMASRHYLAWTVLDLWDIVLFAGPVVVALALGSWSRTRGLALAMAVAIALLVLGGATRGEVGRIWTFLMPPLAVCGAALLTSLSESAFLLAGVAAVFAEVAMTLGLATYLLLVTP